MRSIDEILNGRIKHPPELPDFNKVKLWMAKSLTMQPSRTKKWPRKNCASEINRSVKLRKLTVTALDIFCKSLFQFYGNNLLLFYI